MGNRTTKSEAPPGPPKGDLFPSMRPIIVDKPRYSLVPTKQQQSYYHSQASTTNDRPLAIPEITPIPKTCNSYDIFNSHYYQDKISRQNLNLFKSRIDQNACKRLEEQRLKIQREREIAESRLFSEKETYTRPLTINSCRPFGDRFKLQNLFDTKIFAPKPERPELTPQMLMRIDEASKPQPADEALVEIDGVQLLRKDIRTLIGLNWLNDEVINAYMHLLVVRGQETSRKRVYAFNTFFYPKLKESGYNSVRRWTRKVDIFSYDYLLVPVHLGNHWCLAFIDFIDKTIAYYDSLGGYPMGCCDTLLDYLRYESNDKKKQDFDDENWERLDKYHDDGIPQQKNCSDCGVFACTYAEYLTRSAKLKFKQEDMPYFRKKMIYELVTKKILE